MNLRQFLKDNPAGSALVWAPALVLAALLIYKNLQPANRLSDAKWMFDLNTGLLSVEPRTTPSPSDSGSGSFDYPNLGQGTALVNAVVHSCGDPSDVAAGMDTEQLAAVRAYVNHLERWPPQVINDLADGRAIETLPDFPVLVSAPDGEEWLPSQSPKGSDLLNPSNPLCAGEKIRIARP